MADLWTSKISEYIDGTLSATDRQALEKHLVDCAECRIVLDDLKVVVSQASALTDSPPSADLWQGIADRISANPQAAPVIGIGSRRTRRISLTIPQLLAASVVLMFLSLAAGRLIPTDTAQAPEDAGSAPVIQAAAPSSRLAMDHALSELQDILEEGRSNLDSTTVQILELNLAIIDRAIEQARQAVAADPANGYLQDHLSNTMRQKLVLMRRAADLVEATS